MVLKEAFSNTMAKKKQMGNIEPVPRSVTNNTQGPRMTLGSKVSSPSPTWSYHLNWSDDLPPHIIPPSST